jgi:hypothetical protein
MQRKKVASAVIASVVGILACDKNVPAPASLEPSPTVSAVATVASVTPSSTPAPSASSPPVPSVASAPSASASTARPGAPRSMPPLETACATDADCIMTDQELVDSAHSHACCSGCTNHAGNTAWKKKFDAACLASPAPMCPPIGCAMPIQRPVCVTKKCALK